MTEIDSKSTISQQITNYALSAGFDTIGFTGAALDKVHGVNLKNYIAKGHHGEMTWLKDRLFQRSSPDQLWDDAKSVIMLGLNYGPAQDPRTLLNHTDIGNISVYARGKDYHDVIKKRLKKVARWMAHTYDCDLKVFVDTAPIMEKPLAAAAGLGWQGKHTNVVSPQFGNWLFLGAIITDMILAYDAPHRDQCGSCTACLESCPTNAFTAPYEMDARRCISYLTIELKTAIPHEFRKSVGNRIYGCDDCLAACPWNKFARVSKESQMFSRAELGAPPLDTLARLSDADFRQVFSCSPIKRIVRGNFVSNVLIAIGNSADKGYQTLLQSLIKDENPLVVDAAHWALQQLHE